MSIEDDKLRQIGISYSKINFIKGTANYLVANPNFISKLKQLHPTETITELTKLRGIGIWSASIFAMFHLNHADVFASADSSIAKAILLIYGDHFVAGSDEWNSLMERWTPFRTVACFILWSWVDAKMPKFYLG